MNGELAQVVVLTAFGNAALHKLLSPSDETCLREHSILSQHVRTIQFHDADAKSPSDAVFEWLRNLEGSHVTRLWLTGLGSSGELEPHIAEAFSNSVPRGIAAVLDDGPIVFVPNWHFGRGQKWVVTYKLFQLPNSCVLTGGNPSESLHRLEEKTEQARDFASRAEQDHWCKWFSDAITTMQTGETKLKYLPSHGYSSEARRLISGAAAAWVFGGMGSWNDIWFKDKGLQSEYNRVTEELYAAVSDGIGTAVNAFDPEER
jgi:hypothetical protein